MTKEEILIKSAEIISENGIENFTVGALSEELGIRKASLYYYFDGKDGIIRAMHDYYHQLLLKKGYRIRLSTDLEENLDYLVRYWQNLVFSDDFYDYLRVLLILRQTDERSEEEWQSISLTISGQVQIILEKSEKRADLIAPLFSSFLELKLEKALISGESDSLESLAPLFLSALHRS